MEPILQFLKWSLIVVFALTVAWAGVALTHSLPRASAVERLAQAILAAPPSAAVGKDNAFNAAWLLEFDIPEAARPQVVAAARGGLGHFTVDGYPFDDLSSVDAAVVCQPAEDDCLGKVRAHRAAAAAAVRAHPLALANLAALDRFDHLRREPAVGGMDPVPPLAGPAWLQTTAAALRFVDGERAQGLEQACIAARLWHRLAIRADSFGVQAVASDQYQGDARLIEAMLAELPVDVAIPAACVEAAVPTPVPTVAACDAAKSMYRFQSAALRRVLDPNAARAAGVTPPSRLTRLLFNPEAAIALAAPLYASYCNSDPGIAAAARRVDLARSIFAVGVGQALFDSMGVAMVSSANPRRWRSPHAVLTRLAEVDRTAARLRAQFARRTILVH